MGDDPKCQNSTPQFWMYETHFDTFFIMLVILNVLNHSDAFEYMSVNLMYTLHVSHSDVHYAFHSDVCSAFERMSVFLMCSLHSSFGIPQIAEEVVLHKNHYVACLCHSKQVTSLQ